MKDLDNVLDPKVDNVLKIGHLTIAMKTETDQLVETEEEATKEQKVLREDTAMKEDEVMREDTVKEKALRKTGVIVKTEIMEEEITAKIDTEEKNTKDHMKVLIWCSRKQEKKAKLRPESTLKE